MAGVPLRTLNAARNKMPEFAARWDEAMRIAGDVLEAEAFRRGLEGVVRPVFQKGMQVGTIREYSDSLLKMLLSAAKPEKYGPRVALTGADGGPITFNLNFGPPPPKLEDHTNLIDVTPKLEEG